MKLRTRVTYLLFLTVLAIAGTGVPACGGDWADTFDDGFDQSWTSAGLTRYGTFSPKFYFKADGILSLGDPIRGAGEGDPIQYGAVVGYGFVSQNFTNVRVTGTVNPLHESNLNSSIGLIARGDPMTGTSYSFGIDWIDNYDQPDGQVAIVRNDGPFGEKIIGEAFIEDFALTDSFYLQFDLYGPILRGQVFDQPGGTLLAEVFAFDGYYASGVCGVGAHVNGQGGRRPLYATFDDVSASELPPVVCTVQTSTLWAPNHDLRDVGLFVGTAYPFMLSDVEVYSNETDRGESVDDVSFDAGHLSLSAERNGNGDGRVYLIVVTASDGYGNSATTCCSVVVPHDESEEAFVTVTQEAAAAELECQNSGQAPAGYTLIGTWSGD